VGRSPTGDRRQQRLEGAPRPAQQTRTGKLQVLRVTLDIPSSILIVVLHHQSRHTDNLRSQGLRYNEHRPAHVLEYE
jgi:hypothetical protein